MDGELEDGRPIRTAGALGACAHVGAHAVVCRFRPTLSTRRTNVASLEYLRPANVGGDPRFHFSDMHQFHGDYRHPPIFMGWADGLSSGRHFESVGSAQYD